MSKSAWVTCRLKKLSALAGPKVGHGGEADSRRHALAGAFGKIRTNRVTGARGSECAGFSPAPGLVWQSAKTLD